MYRKRPNRDDRNSRLMLLIALASSLAVASCGGGSSSEEEEISGDEDGPFLPVPPLGLLTPRAVSQTLVFEQISTSHHHTCALLRGGQTWCWGSNEYGQLGSTASMPRCSGGNIPCTGQPVAVERALPFQEMAASIRHTCALDLSGRAWCWGFGLGGQLGDGRREDSTVPVAVAGDHEFVHLAASASGLVTCGLTRAGEAWCWGPDTDGVLGNGTRTGSDTPTRVQMPTPIASVSVGQMHACAVDTSGAAYCWGSNFFGQLGVGKTARDGGIGRSTTPVHVAGNLGFASIDAGGELTCALTTTGRAYCWGLGHTIGSSTTQTYVATPTAVAGDATYLELATGFAHACGRRSTGALDCWGENLGGQLGDGTTVDRILPQPVSSTENFATLAAGSHTCAISVAGTAWCWGNNAWGGAGGPPTDP
jgi:alpha-tubulin suppressor-like RCC1 family protein